MAWMAAWCRCCLPARESLLDEMQAQTEALLEMRNDQRELLNLQKDWSELAAAATEEPATLDSTEVRAMPFPVRSLQPRMRDICSGALRGGRGACMTLPEMLVCCNGQSIGITEMSCMCMQVVERTEIAQKVFREEPYAENTLVVQNITTFFGCGSKYELEKVKGPKKFSLIKIKVWHDFSAHALALLPDIRAALQLTPAVCDVHPRVCHAMTDQNCHTLAEVWHAGWHAHR